MSNIYNTGNINKCYINQQVIINNYGNSYSTYEEDQDRDQDLELFISSEDQYEDQYKDQDLPIYIRDEDEESEEEDMPIILEPEDEDEEDLPIILESDDEHEEENESIEQIKTIQYKKQVQKHITEYSDGTKEIHERVITHKITDEHTKRIIKPKSTQMIISEQQQIAANEIIQHFKSNQRWCILSAHMQSGKSTTYYLAAAEMLRLKLVENVVIFSGNTEKELRDQVMNENKTKFLQSYRNYYLRYVLLFDEDERNSIISDIEYNLNVLWGRTMEKHRFNPTNTFYIWDESHYAQNRNMGPHKFLQKIGISADGNLDNLIRMNSYMLSVSATPFSEYSDNYHLNQNKVIVRLLITDAYHGIQNMLNNNLIKGFNTNNLKTNLMSIMSKHSNTDSPKYGLIRLRDSKKNTGIDEVRQCVRSKGWKCLTFDSSECSDITSITELEKQPTKNTIVLLKGKCRMGKVVPNQHIAFCVETSRKPDTDVILQGLMGRMCGYNKNTNVEIYVSNEVIHAGELEKYVSYTNQQDVIPSRAKNLGKPRKSSKSELYKTIPIKISNYSRAFNSWDSEHYANHTLAIWISELFANNNEFNLKITNKNPQNQYQDIVQRIINNPQDISVRNIQLCQQKHKIGETTYQAAVGFYGRQLIKHFEHATPSECGAENLKIIVWKINNDLYIDARTNIPSEEQQRQREQQQQQQSFTHSVETISKTTRKELFYRG